MSPDYGFEGTYKRLDYLGLVRRYWMSLLLAILIGTTVGSVWHFASPTRYSSQASVMVTVVEPAEATVQDAVAADTLALGGAKTAEYLGRSNLVIDDMAKSLNENSREQLSKRIQVENQVGTRILEVTATGENPSAASRTADAWVMAMQRAFTAASGTTRLRLERVGETQTPRSIEAKPLSLELAVGLLLGVLSWIAQVIARESRKTNAVSGAVT